MAQPFHIRLLKDELSKRMKRNPRYSLRAMAKALAVSPSNLSRTLSGERRLSMRSALRLASNLHLPPQERKRFIASVERASAGKRSWRAPPEARLQAAEIGLETFQAISEWYHYAILELTLTDGFLSDTRWIAAKLNIPPMQAKLAIERLVALGLLKLDSGRLVKVKKTIRTDTTAISSAALQAHQRQILAMATKAIDDVPVSERVSVSMTLPADREKIELARKIIHDFSLEVCQKLSAGARDSVFQMNISLFPLTTQER